MEINNFLFCEKSHLLKMFKALSFSTVLQYYNINAQVMFMITYGLHGLQRDCLEIFKVSEIK
jgi:hypothetical protein